jgi:hypothetical protein
MLAKSQQQRQIISNACSTIPQSIICNPLWRVVCMLSNAFQLITEAQTQLLACTRSLKSSGTTFATRNHSDSTFSASCWKSTAPAAAASLSRQAETVEGTATVSTRLPLCCVCRSDVWSTHSISSSRFRKLVVACALSSLDKRASQDGASFETAKYW